MTPTRFLLTILLILLFSLSLLIFPLTSSSAAPTCRKINEHTICLLTIKRSAKNYWEYRAAVKIDDQIFPIERFNCRDRTKTDPTGHTTPFQPHGAGPLICQLLYR